ncbi:putative 26S proteasome non-ATPase regulatory subunit Nas2 [Aspergillus homomorphus CBS 101889]|uniref:Probable 26S proteasome regulatory subunit p27 n=1 Tax=Aspergillus homomorphus (strain CBS 101889) TaxID=1450537 RepID=A0A395HHX4_ASPHC|nr:26S proteasome non-ATPase regulatory subunit Nas2 [Aspergillus homomorphus CBS 101889]RAL07407.1 26S proteasome non-ATPase regulatory subunit Nas2 [Aspergillus homomorphus CBS 101889]
MGVPMDSNNNIHAPTVVSGPTSGEAPSRDLSKLGVVDLMQEKERIEEELSALSSVLSSHGVHMNTSLTTFDGFPRDDIDVAQIRTTRARIIRLRTDHKEVMSLLENGIHDHFASLQRAQVPAPSAGNINSTQATQASAAGGGASETGTAGVPFARVNSVVPGSPADQAGLKAGDTVRNFGSVDWLNHERLSKVAQVVQQSEGRPVTVVITRKEPNSANIIELNLELTPRRDWGGRGLLGCHLVPL